MNPAESGHGILFRHARTRQEIAVHPSNILSTVRCTALAANGVAVQTVEHVLSAVSGCGISDIELVYDGPEIPIMDGSAAPFVAAIREAGIVGLDSGIEPIVVTAPVTVYGDGVSVITVLPSNKSWICLMIDYPEKPKMLAQAASFYGHGYDVDIAPARTFGFVAELAALAARGLALGASKENAFALYEDGSPDESTPLRFANEAARHKLLDLIGDLALVGRPVRAGIIAVRPSHAINARLSAQLYAIGS
jgi:UDP-3-O-[3-hydroxymyristoyl] N-acetylglucosamine deacetylase